MSSILKKLRLCYFLPFTHKNYEFKFSSKISSKTQFRSYKDSFHGARYSDDNLDFKPPPKPFNYTPGEACVDEDVSPEVTNSTGYSIYAACLGPFIDSRHWYAEAKPIGDEKLDAELDKSEESGMEGLLEKIDNNSLEELRKRLLLKRQLEHCIVNEAIK